MKKIVLFLVFVVLLFSITGICDEGMWLLNNLPEKYLKEKYNFEVTDQWLELVQKAAVRFPHGTGAFCSSEGLVATNYHIASRYLQELSTKEHNYYRDGFLARSRDKELKCPGLKLISLESIKDVTDKVNVAVKPDMNPEEAFKARRAVIAAIEKESQEKTGFLSWVIMFYQGGQYHLYRYREYTDIRLVFAPENAVGLFGGDPDNFEYPRYNLDIALFRAYENEKPAKIKHFFRWSEAGAMEDELVFVVGNPGSTNRLDTVAKLKFWRDQAIPFVLNFLRRLEILYQQFGNKSEEQKRIAKDELFGVQNARKLYYGVIKGLQDPDLMAKKVKAEVDLRSQVANDPWDNIEQAQNPDIYKRFKLIEGWIPYCSDLLTIARGLVRLAEETQKPNEDRLPEYRETNLKHLRDQLFSPAPISLEFERVRLADWLSVLAEFSGCDDAFVKKILAGKSPSERASELISGTKLANVDVRKEIADGGLKVIKESTDSLIQFALLIDPVARWWRKRYDETQEIERQNYAKIAKAIFALKGADVYPDATFTLRLAFGVVKGYIENNKNISYQTTLAGLFEHAANHGNKEPWNLPREWFKKKKKLNPKAQLNFVATLDITGGNSGSSVLNRKGEVVGLAFDSNIHGLANDYVYTEKQARAIMVSSQAILEALRKIYKAGFLADEIGH